MRAEDISGGAIDSHSVAFHIDPKTHNSALARSNLKPGDLLITIAGSLGRVGYVPNDAPPLNCNQAVSFIRLRPDLVDVKFACFACQHKKVTSSLVDLKKVGTIGNLNLQQIREFRIPLPPLTEQKRIAAILEKADHLRRQRHYALELSNTYLQSVFLEMFGDLTVNPNQWQIGQLFQLCTKIVDCPHATPIYSSNQTAYACIRSSDIQNGFLDWSTTKYISRSEFEKRIRVTVPMPKDVVYCREGARFGNAAMIPVGKQVCLGQRTMLFRADPNAATPEFIWAFLESESTRKQAIRLAGGSASPHLNVGDIKEFVTIIPPLPLQQKFAQIVKKFERLRTQQREAERQAEHLFQTLLHQAFEGNVGLGSGIGQGNVVEDGVQTTIVSSELMGSYVQLHMKY